MDTFSDVELLCDILEACALRNVRVYVLLDRLNVQQFLDMCLTLNVSGEHFPVSLRLLLSYRLLEVNHLLLQLLKFKL